MIVCVDLDRTLIYSAGALDLADGDAPVLLPVERHRGGSQSFLTETSAALLARLATVATVVPTTTRTRAQLDRVRLPGPPAHFAIAANGGHLLVDGEPDRGWATLVAARLRACAALVEIDTHLRARAGSFVTAVRSADDLFAYAVVDRAALPARWVEELAAWCAARGWRVSVQGRKVYAVPAPLTKAAAALEIRRRCGGGTLLAAGDSLLDADLLDAADAAIRPAHGELADTGFTRDHLSVTAATGVRAGEELLAWLDRRARAERMAPTWRSGTS